jgi:hypothetical protein
VDKITLESRDGREVRVTFGPYTLSTSEAASFARALLAAVREAHDLPSIHERHVDLQASCALCRGEAGAQTDRLTYDEPMSGERFVTLAEGKWVVAETEATSMKRARTIRGDVTNIRLHEGKPIELSVVDKAGRTHMLDISRLRVLRTGGENGKVLVQNGTVSYDYWIAR